MKFWDSSAIIPLCIEEPRSRIVHEIAKKDGSLVVWWGTLVECYSAFSRLRRSGLLTGEEDAQVCALLAFLADSWTEIEPSEDIRDINLRLLQNYPLKAADSLQLAAAVIWAEKLPRRHQVVCLDSKLRDALSREGFEVLPSEFMIDE
jgi:predicted nucleic acid-binding protein